MPMETDLTDDLQVTFLTSLSHYRSNKNDKIRSKIEDAGRET
jgi:hypothetical protein